MRTKLRFLGIVLVALMAARCAQISNPSGGPKDVTPPEVLGTSPLNGSANFEGDKFTIYFSEFIELDNITQKAMISPPVDKLPDFKLKGKSLQVKFEDELLPNTTYSVYFGDAIVDITERNPLLNYTFLFSTGATVDSMAIVGHVVNAFDLTPPEEVFVILYKDNNDTIPLDSMPLLVKPYYLSKTDENGEFYLNGLANEPYLMFAVKDLNNNYFYDQPGEEIAFVDSMIMPQYLSPPELDSSLFDTLDFESPYFDSIQQAIDSIFKDSLMNFQQNIVHHELFLFDEPDTNMALQKAETIRRNVFRFSFTRPAEEVEFHVLNYESDSTWYLEEVSRDKDTIHWYLRQLPSDTIELVLLYEGDTLAVEYMRTDPKRKTPGLERRRKKDEEKEIEYLGVSSRLRGGTIRPNQQPELVFDYPVAEVLSDSILLVFGEDSIYNPTYLFMDSLKRILRFPVEVLEETRYSIVIPDSSFIDWNGLYNKKQNFRYSSKSLREYGVLTLEMKPEVAQPYIVQLLTEKESVVRELYFNGDTTLNMLYLDPGSYKLKVIFDDNGNRKYDPGFYSMQLQPEKVIYFPKLAVIRGNWDLEEEWRITR